MTELEQEIAHLQELQAKHRRNIRTLGEMLANYGMERPLPLLNNLEFEREQLRQVEERLAAALAGQAEPGEAPAAPAEPAPTPPTGQVSVTGSGAAAVGEGATAAGAGGVAVGGKCTATLSSPTAASQITVRRTEHEAMAWANWRCSRAGSPGGDGQIVGTTAAEFRWDQQ